MASATRRPSTAALVMPPGVARALAARVQTADIRLKAVVADDAHGARAAGLYGSHDSTGIGEAMQLAVQGRQRLGEGVGHKRWQAIA